MSTIDGLTHLLSHYGYVILLPAAVVEGPIVTIIARALISLGLMSFLPAYIIIIIGDTIGDALHYAVGRYGGTPLVRKWGKYLGVQPGHIEALEKSFQRHETKSYLLGKLAHGVGGAVLVVAGLVRAPFGRFLWWNVLGTAMKSFALLLLGYYFAHALSQIGSTLDLLASALVILGVIAFFGVFWWYGRKYKTA